MLACVGCSVQCTQLPPPSLQVCQSLETSSFCCPSSICHCPSIQPSSEVSHSSWYGYMYQLWGLSIWLELFQLPVLTVQVQVQVHAQLL